MIKNINKYTNKQCQKSEPSSLKLCNVQHTSHTNEHLYNRKFTVHTEMNFNKYVS